MSDRQKETDELIEKEHEVLIKSFKRKAYWTFKEGIYHLLPPEYRQGRFPIQFVIDESLFDDIKRDVEARKLKTINTPAEITEIINYDPQALWKRYEQENPRKKPRQKLTYSEIIKEKQNYFYKNIKVKPDLFIRYINENLSRFSEINIPPELKSIEITGEQENLQIADALKNKKSSVIKLKKELEVLLKKFYPEIECLYMGFTKKFKNIRGIPISQGDKHTFKEMALAFYTQNKITFKYLKEEHIQSENIYEIKVNQKRATIGKILKIIVDDDPHQFARDPEITIHGNVLYKLATDLFSTD